MAVSSARAAGDVGSRGEERLGADVRDRGVQQWVSGVRDGPAHQVDEAGGQVSGTVLVRDGVRAACGGNDEACRGAPVGQGVESGKRVVQEGGRMLGDAPVLGCQPPGGGLCDGGS